MNVITPLNKRVLVEPQAKEKVSKGGIVIPQNANKKAPTKGRIIAIAEDADIRLKISPGDLVLFPSFAGTEITVPADSPESSDRSFQLMKEDDILAVIHAEDARKS